MLKTETRTLQQSRMCHSLAQPGTHSLTAPERVWAQLLGLHRSPSPRQIPEEKVAGPSIILHCCEESALTLGCGRAHWLVLSPPVSSLMFHAACQWIPGCRRWGWAMTASRSPVSSRQVGQGSLWSQTTCNFGQASPLCLDFHLGAIVNTIMPTA